MLNALAKLVDDLDTNHGHCCDPTLAEVPARMPGLLADLLTARPALKPLAADMDVVPCLCYLLDLHGHGTSSEVRTPMLALASCRGEQWPLSQHDMGL